MHEVVQGTTTIAPINTIMPLCIQCLEGAQGKVLGSSIAKGGVVLAATAGEIKQHT